MGTTFGVNGSGKMPCASQRKELKGEKGKEERKGREKAMEKSTLLYQLS